MAYLIGTGGKWEGICGFKKSGQMPALFPSNRTGKNLEDFGD
ncbi:hypothetical protein C943_01209 [Mariniradius saccharolyticus AK6]|uniref:Uncharacterized protein n=1 Tax=Mariniradius saccharolyticus AK6 TaxID=1239962 RepID=M7XVH0_9BACT|nr:hypothetical protein C943_01209 [Mariniradius saccharolyticus AK6]